MLQTLGLACHLRVHSIQVRNCVLAFCPAWRAQLLEELAGQGHLVAQQAVDALSTLVSAAAVASHAMGLREGMLAGLGRMAYLCPTVWDLS